MRCLFLVRAGRCETSYESDSEQLSLSTRLGDGGTMNSWCITENPTIASPTAHTHIAVNLNRAHLRCWSNEDISISSFIKDYKFKLHPMYFWIYKENIYPFDHLPKIMDLDFIWYIFYICKKKNLSRVVLLCVRVNPS